MHCSISWRCSGSVATLQLEFEVREDAEQRVVDLVGGSESELREGGVFFVFRELGLELDFVFVELAFFVQAAEEFVLRDVALLFALLYEGPRAFKFAGEGRNVFALEEPDHE